MPGMPDWVRETVRRRLARLLINRGRPASPIADRTDFARIMGLKIAIGAEKAGRTFSTDRSSTTSCGKIRKETCSRADGAMRGNRHHGSIERRDFPVRCWPEGVQPPDPSCLTNTAMPKPSSIGHALEGNLHFVFTQAFDYWR